MTQNKALRSPIRRQIIKEHLVDENYDELAARCHCARTTIDRDIRDMRQTGELSQFLLYGMLKYGRSSNVSDTAKFNKFADLWAKYELTQKTQATHDIQAEVKHSVGDNLITTLEKYRPIIEALTRKSVGSSNSDSRESMDSH